MFQIALITGIYSYILFALGISGVLFRGLVSVSFLIFTSLIFYNFAKVIKLKDLKAIKAEKFSLVLAFLILIQTLINFIGVLGPEISFDALWYHLTFPKLYLLAHQIQHFPGGLLYYSDMPKLMEMIYTGPISLGGEILVKFVNFIFGGFLLMSLYKISRIYLSRKFSLLSVLIFYSNLVVGWESISAYVDLPRTFFEVTAVYVFLTWVKNKDTNSFLLSASILGIAIATKLISLFSIIPFLIFVYIYSKKKIQDSLIFAVVALFISVPWFLFSFLNTGSFFYPFGQIQTSANSGFFELSRFFEDPLSPIYLIIIPLFVLNFKKLWKDYSFLITYCITGILFWYLTSRVAGSRYLLPQIAVLSVLAAIIIDKYSLKFKQVLVFIVIFISVVSIVYRAGANYKFIPVIFGRETKSEFLKKNLNFSYGDFYDVDGYFKNNLKDTDKVLLFGFHNLYYIDFPFVDSSYIQNGEKFNYIATQNTTLPKRFSDWRMIYTNSVTNVSLYSLGGQQWVY